LGSKGPESQNSLLNSLIAGKSGGDGRDQHCNASQAFPRSEVLPLKDQKSPLLAAFCNSAPVSELPNSQARMPFWQKSPANTANIPVLGRQRPETWFDRDCRPRAAVDLAYQFRQLTRSNASDLPVATKAATSGVV
jgi:hypothetical protein